MDLPTHKIVNGVRVDLTPEEIDKILQEWKKEDQIALENKQVREDDCNNCVKILRDSGLSNEAILILKPEYKLYL